ncbi:MAG: sulfur oxidation c-type cytochrome SoxX [Alphaproteobacteria bacterium]
MKPIRTLALAAILAGTAGVAAADQHPKLKIVDDGVPVSLTGQAGDAASGMKIMINRKQGNCLACHVISKMSNQPFHGEIGPSLDGVAGRYNEAQFRLILANSKKVFDGTIMPAFYRDEGFSRTAKKFKGKTILSAKQIEDVIAFLLTMK